MTEKAIEMISKLVGFDTISSKSNLDLINFVKDYLSGFGIESNLVYNDDKTKANLYAVIGPNVPGGIVLSGHTDIVPTAGQPWTSDPFKVVSRDGRLYGRGVADMKSFSAINLSLVPEMVEANLQRPIIIALTFDEEIGCLSAPFLAKAIVENVPKPAAVIVGEPTNMKAVESHKSTTVCRTIVTGKEAHSSQLHCGVSAIHNATKLISFLLDEQEIYKKNDYADSGFVPPYSTIHVGMIEGGTAINIVSRECTFQWDARHMPSDDRLALLTRFRAYSDTLLEEMKAISPDCNIVTEELALTPPLKPEEEGMAGLLCRMLTGDPELRIVSYATEAGHYQLAGLSAIVCGPGCIDQAHKADEFIEISEIEKGIAFVRNLIAHSSE